MKTKVGFIFLLSFIVTIVKPGDNKSTHANKEMYAFIMVINKANSKLFFSPVFSFQVDKKGTAICDLKKIEKNYKAKVANDQWDVMTSDYFESKDEAEQAKKTYMKVERSGGREVIETTEDLEKCTP
jgi:uncharacterized Ntn-hydrolase superfamily protein